MQETQPTPQPVVGQIMELRSAGPRFGTIGGSKKLTFGVVIMIMTSFVAMAFDKMGIALETQAMFWDMLQSLIYMYFGGQSAVDLTKEVRKGLEKYRGQPGIDIVTPIAPQPEGSNA